MCGTVVGLDSGRDPPACTQPRLSLKKETWGTSRVVSGIHQCPPLWFSSPATWLARRPLFYVVASTFSDSSDAVKEKSLSLLAVTPPPSPSGVKSPRTEMRYRPHPSCDHRTHSKRGNSP